MTARSRFPDLTVFVYSVHHATSHHTGHRTQVTGHRSQQRVRDPPRSAVAPIANVRLRQPRSPDTEQRAGQRALTTHSSRVLQTTAEGSPCHMSQRTQGPGLSLVSVCSHATREWVRLRWYTIAPHAHPTAQISPSPHRLSTNAASIVNNSIHAPSSPARVSLSLPFEGLLQGRHSRPPHALPVIASHALHQQRQASTTRPAAIVLKHHGTETHKRACTRHARARV